MRAAASAEICPIRADRSGESIRWKASATPGATKTSGGRDYDFGEYLRFAQKPPLGLVHGLVDLIEAVDGKKQAVDAVDLHRRIQHRV